ncbi:protein of unknown function [endosymbiont DhMRE of Dentiscutata heterogama]|uniref:hypothetical protein n=1 Tax=endosymbiont DhMRE of Dentiscutata heterogama TaxID=1609546 RepID=UPI000629D3C1|nr:hypothetical protein [endosymbiont DhMRE of Dentiscutata heterogama]CFW92827.1 protein of unknown function [endosymbiont DhMRE of Dentiscutata heterogama]
MFKGFKKEFQDQLKKNNQEGSTFAFSFGDLELVEINDKRRKCRIISEELSKELQKLISGGSKPTFIFKWNSPL